MLAQSIDALEIAKPIANMIPVIGGIVGASIELATNIARLVQVSE